MTRLLSVILIINTALLLAGCSNNAVDFLPERDFTDHVETPESYAALFDESERDLRIKNHMSSVAYVNKHPDLQQDLEGNVTYFLRGVESNNTTVFEFLYDREELLEVYSNNGKGLLPRTSNFLSSDEMAAYLYRLEDQDVILISNKDDDGGFRFSILRDDIGCLRYKRYSDFSRETGYYKDWEGSNDWEDVFGELDPRFATDQDCAHSFDVNDISPKEGWVATWVVPLFDKQRIVPGSIEKLKPTYKQPEPSCKRVWITYLAEVNFYNFTSDSSLEDDSKLVRFTNTQHDDDDPEIWNVGPPCARLEMVINEMGDVK